MNIDGTNFHLWDYAGEMIWLQVTFGLHFNIGLESNEQSKITINHDQYVGVRVFGVVSPVPEQLQILMNCRR